MKTQNLILEKGASLYLAFMMMTVLLVIAFGMSAILFGQMKIIGGMGDSVIAFYAADTGIERALYENATPPQTFSDSIGGASYNVSVISPGSDACPSDVNYCIKSIGIYKETRRAIQVNR